MPADSTAWHTHTPVTHTQLTATLHSSKGPPCRGVDPGQVAYLEAPFESRLLLEEACLAGWAGSCDPRDLELAVAKPSDCAVARECPCGSCPASASSKEFLG